MPDKKKNNRITEDDDNNVISVNYNDDSLKKLEESVTSILTEIGEDPKREGLLRTPNRVAKAYKFLTKGYEEDVEKLLNNAIFNEHYDEMVIVKDIDFYSLCEHHMLPFFGKCHIAYIPKGKIVGLSKLPRLVEMYSRRLQVQERMTREIGDMINKILEPKGVAVVTEARHLCMMMRGVEKQNSVATASCMLGRFKSDEKTRAEFLKLIGK
jgi:GTP cyclohydrolase I